MSKIGRKPINIAGLQVDIEGQVVRYKGKNASGEHVLPEELASRVEGDLLYLDLAHKDRVTKKVKSVWGLNRAILADKLHGAQTLFENNIEINGLGYKAVKSGSNLVLSLGYSHKIDFNLPEGVAVDIDKTGQKVTFKSHSKELVGLVCSKVRALREPEPYKGTGVKLANEVILRKAGKTKAA